MGKISNAILTVEGMFFEAKKKYEHWAMLYCAYYLDDDYDISTVASINASYYYGQMCALAKLNKELLGDPALEDILKEITPIVAIKDMEARD